MVSSKQRGLERNPLFPKPHPTLELNDDVVPVHSGSRPAAGIPAAVKVNLHIDVSHLIHLLSDQQWSRSRLPPILYGNGITTQNSGVRIPSIRHRLLEPKSVAHEPVCWKFGDAHAMGNGEDITPYMALGVEVPPHGVALEVLRLCRIEPVGISILIGILQHQ